MKYKPSGRERLNIYGYPDYSQYEQRREITPGVLFFAFLVLLVFCLSYFIGARFFSGPDTEAQAVKTGIKKHDKKLAQKYYHFLYQKEYKK